MLVMRDATSVILALEMQGDAKAYKRKGMIINIFHSNLKCRSIKEAAWSSVILTGNVSYSGSAFVCLLMNV